MKYTGIGSSLLLWATLAAGCSENARVPTAADPTASSLASKGKASSTTDTDPRARLVFDDSDIFTILSDGKGTYQGDVCGVHAKIFVGGSGDLVFDPDKSKDRKCPDAPRKIVFEDGGQEVVSGSFMNVGDVWSIAVGQVVSRRVGFDGTGLSGCDRLVFSDATVTRIDDGSGARAWTVESSGEGTCRIWSGGAYVDNGTKVLPFRIALEEVK